MEKITEYKCAFAKTFIELQDTVNELIKQGWQPFGSLHGTLVVNKSERIEGGCSQALVKYQ
jgi:hypothetical protein